MKRTIDMNFNELSRGGASSLEKSMFRRSERSNGSVTPLAMRSTASPLRERAPYGGFHDGLSATTDFKTLTAQDIKILQGNAARCNRLRKHLPSGTQGQSIGSDIYEGASLNAGLGMPPSKRQSHKRHLYELKKSLMSKAHMEKIINVDYDELKGNAVRRFA